MTSELRVGLIDSGCSPGQAAMLLDARRFWLADGVLQEGAALPDALGHGSAVLDRIHAEAGAMPLLLAQVFDRQWSTSALQVAAALLWLVEEGATVINLSLGLHQDRPVLRQACAEAQAAGVLLCASSPARGEAVYPASYPGVIRVTGDARCAPGEWSWLGTAQADFGAHVGTTGGAGASLACGAFSGRVAAVLRNRPGLEHMALIHWLKHHAAFTGPERKGQVDG
ncbi:MULTISPECIES: subtilisin-like serine protease QhpE [Pseudomonas]|uniref:subtilisin-like serine protease QhpE n=1 Tax=Pseudomonas TaxID=286 RepID=UPI001E5DB3CE|nr:MULTISPECIES: S8 family serine peptidase [Pseudomonas]MCE1117974.1 S8 family serine peptidase [Pseudomonas sp. NMI795_08]